jgi:type I restriction enzyme S subunit
MERGQLTSKPSNIPWLGQVPDHWEVKRLKYLASTNDEALAESADPTQEIVYVEIGGVDAIEGIVAKEQLVLEDAPSRARRLVKEGDTIVSTVRTYLRAIAPIRDPEPNMVVSTGFAVIRPRKLYHDYLGYALRAPYFVESIVSRSTGVSYPGINASEIGNIEVAYPPLPEQRAIATYLDERTARIDGLVARQRRLVQLLKEKRQALITRAVTRGLNPNAKMKDSGVPWLGEVPELWVVKKIKYLAADESNSFMDGDWIESPVITSSGIRYITTGNIGEGVYKEQGEGFISEETFHELRCTEVFPGDMLFSRLSLPVGRSCIIPDLGYRIITSVDNVIFRPKPIANKEFLVYQSNIPVFFQYTDLMARGSTLVRVSRSMLGGISLILPPRAEQDAIVEFLQGQCARIDTLLTKVDQAISRLQEYRTALISAAVTGKVRVPAG